MALHKWRRDTSPHFGEIRVPYAQIEIRARDGRYQATALRVDSGAVISLLRRSFADLLGVELDEGKKVELGSVGGAQTTCYIHELHTRFDDSIEFLVPFAIAATENVPNLLGRLGVFDRLRIEFDGQRKHTRITVP